jgi:hypothetical protein
VCIDHLGNEGETCYSTSDCVAGLVCNIGICSQPGKEGDSCSSAPCEAGLICNSSIMCGKPILGKEGDSCVTNKDCDAGMKCGNDLRVIFVMVLPRLY